MVASGKSDLSVVGGSSIVNEDNLPNFSDPEDFIDDISNEGFGMKNKFFFFLNLIFI